MNSVAADMMAALRKASEERSKSPSKTGNGETQDEDGNEGAQINLNDQKRAHQQAADADVKSPVSGFKAEMFNESDEGDEDLIDPADALNSKTMQGVPVRDESTIIHTNSDVEHQKIQQLEQQLLDYEEEEDPGESDHHEEAEEAEDDYGDYGEEEEQSEPVVEEQVEEAAIDSVSISQKFNDMLANISGEKPRPESKLSTDQAEGAMPKFELPPEEKKESLGEEVDDEMRLSPNVPSPRVPSGEELLIPTSMSQIPQKEEQPTMGLNPLSLLTSEKESKPIPTPPSNPPQTPAESPSERLFPSTGEFLPLEVAEAESIPQQLPEPQMPPPPVETPPVTAPSPRARKVSKLPIFKATESSSQALSKQQMREFVHSKIQKFAQVKRQDQRLDPSFIILKEFEQFIEEDTARETERSLAPKIDFLSLDYDQVKTLAHDLNASKQLRQEISETQKKVEKLDSLQLRFSKTAVHAVKLNDKIRIQKWKKNITKLKEMNSDLKSKYISLKSIQKRIWNIEQTEWLAGPPTRSAEVQEEQEPFDHQNQLRTEEPVNMARIPSASLAREGRNAEEDRYMPQPLQATSLANPEPLPISAVRKFPNVTVDESVSPPPHPDRSSEEYGRGLQQTQPLRSSLFNQTTSQSLAHQEPSASIAVEKSSGTKLNAPPSLFDKFDSSPAKKTDLFSKTDPTPPAPSASSMPNQAEEAKEETPLKRRKDEPSEPLPVACHQNLISGGLFSNFNQPQPEEKKQGVPAEKSDFGLGRQEGKETVSVTSQHPSSLLFSNEKPKEAESEQALTLPVPPPAISKALSQPEKKSVEAVKHEILSTSPSLEKSQSTSQPTQAVKESQPPPKLDQASIQTLKKASQGSPQSEGKKQDPKPDPGLEKSKKKYDSSGSQKADKGKGSNLNPSRSFEDEQYKILSEKIADRFNQQLGKDFQPISERSIEESGYEKYDSQHKQEEFAIGSIRSLREFEAVGDASSSHLSHTKTTPQLSHKGPPEGRKRSKDIKRDFLQSIIENNVEDDKDQTPRGSINPTPPANSAQAQASLSAQHLSNSQPSQQSHPSIGEGEAPAGKPSQEPTSKPDLGKPDKDPGAKKDAEQFPTRSPTMGEIFSLEDRQGKQKVKKVDLFSMLQNKNTEAGGLGDQKSTNPTAPTVPTGAASGTGSSKKDILNHQESKPSSKQTSESNQPSSQQPKSAVTQPKQLNKGPQSSVSNDIQPEHDPKNKTISHMSNLRKHTGSFHSLQVDDDETIFQRQPSYSHSNDLVPSSQYQTKNSNFKSDFKSQSQMAASRSIRAKQVPITVRLEQENIEKIQGFISKVSQPPKQDLPNVPDGIVLQNVNSEQLTFILMYMHQKQKFEKLGLSPRSTSDYQANGTKDDEIIFDNVFAKLQIPTDLIQQMEILQIADYFLIDHLPKLILSQVVQNKVFAMYTNVRRYLLFYLHQFMPTLKEPFIGFLNPNILIFMLTDPTLAHFLPDLKLFKQSIKSLYRAYTIDRIEEEERLKQEEEESHLIFADDLQVFPKGLKGIYNDTREEQKFADTLADMVIEQISELREIFLTLPKEFDFHQCFHYAVYQDLNNQHPQGSFKLHQRYEKAKDFEKGDSVPMLKHPLILLSAIKADGFIGSFCEIFQLSRKFSMIRVLNLRGCDSQIISKQKLRRILKSCSQVAHLNLSFMREQVSNDTLGLIGEKLQKTLVSLELRGCQQVTDDGVVDLCEKLSGVHSLRNGKKVENENQRYQIYNDLKESKSKLRFLNLSDLKGIGNPSMKAISWNLYNCLEDLCVWGSYVISDDGFLKLCTMKSETFNRINYCGCYKISEENSRQWLHGQFKQQVQVYIQVDDFGINIDYTYHEEDEG